MKFERTYFATKIQHFNYYTKETFSDAVFIYCISSLGVKTSL